MADAATDFLNNGILPQETQTKGRVTFGLDANPDDAARTLDLSRSTGVPSSVIAPDLDHFDKSNQAQMARDLVMNNGQLRDYVNSHPLAAQVSNDDWGTLDKISEAATTFAQLHKALGGAVGQAAGAEGEATLAQPNVIGSTLSGAASAAKEAFGEGPLYDPVAIAKQFPLADPSKGLLASALNLSEGAVQLGFRGLGAVSAGIAGGAGGLASGFGASPELAQGIREMAESALVDAGSRAGPGRVPKARLGEVGEVGATGTGVAHIPGEPWILAGRELPAGLHPEFDAAKAEINARVVDQLDALLKEAQASATKERSPEMFKSFMDQHFGNNTVGINGDAVAKLYGDKAPAPDDNLLGWHVGINDKVDAARATGADVEIPVSDWVSHVDPAVAEKLHDDIRGWPGGITANEAKELPPTQKEMIDAPLAQVRGASNLEPMFSMGDRKLTLAPVSIDEADPNIWKGGQFHTLEIRDDTGRKVGDLTLAPDPATKNLNVEMINGVAGQWANSFGPGLIMDLKRQLKALYPDYDTLTGERVSGAAPDRRVLIKLDDTPAGWGSIEGARRTFAGAYRPVGETGVDVKIQPSAAYLTHEKALAGAVHEEIAKLTGGKLKAIPTAGIRFAGRTPRGAYFPGSGMMVYDLLGDDPIGTGRHEAIHFLREQGLFTGPEWDTLTNTARDEGWADRHNINARYPNLSPERKVEESIAEGFREWAKAREGARREYSPVTQIFQKMWDLLQAVKGRMAEIFGHLPTKDELFSRVASGEIGERGAQGTAEGGAPRFSEEDHLDNLRASGLGLDLKSFQRLQKLYEERHKADVEASLKHTEREQARRQTKEWKDNKAEMAKDVEETIRQRPDVAADLFIGSGELYGEKLQQRFTLRAGDLTPEQRSALPAHYTSAHGLPVDDVAHMFGYTSGDVMVDHMTMYNSLKEGRSPQEMLRYVVNAEADRQMEAKYGNLADNILTDAKDQALSENSIDVLTEEYHAAALQAGITAIDKATARAAVEEIVGKTKLGELNSDKYIATMAKHGNAAERALIAEDYPTAVQAMQKKLLAALLAQTARKVEKEMTGFDKLAKTMSKRVVPSMEPEYTNYVHQILQAVGKPVRRSVQDLQEAIAAGHSKDLSDFVDWKTSALREMPVWDQLFNPGWRKDYKSLTVEEFHNVNDSVRTLIHNGRDEQKIYKAGEAADFADVKQSLIEKVARFKEIAPDIKGKPTGVLSRGVQPVKTFIASHMQIETILNHWDEEDPWGPWNQYVMRDLIDGVNQEAAFRKEYAKRLRAAKDDVDLKKSVDNTLFREPSADGTGRLFRMNRGKLRAVILNMGNASNEAKFARGWGLTVDQVRGWVHQHATKEDWDFAQKIWDMHDDIWDKVKTMYRSLSGVAPKAIDIRPVDTPFGRYKGGYYPVIYHPEFEGTSKRMLGKDALEGEGYQRATPPSGYTKERTGYSAPMSFELDMLSGRIGQELHDLAMRPAVINVSKVFLDHDVRAAIMKHYGTETRDLLVPYLRDVANSANYKSRAQAQFAGWSEFLRQNMVATLVGVNPGTVMKHAPTAFVQSMIEVGPSGFLKATKGLFSINEETGETNWNFATGKSLELQRRHQNYEESVTGAAQQLSPGGGLDSLRHTVIRYGTTPVALSDLLSAVPTWLTAYERGWKERGNEGDAVFAADRAVRRAHGSSAITSRPGIMRDMNPWLTSVYTFFSHIMNRQAELVWRAGDMLGDTGRADYAKAMAKIPGVSAQLFAYVLFPALVEELVSPLTTSDNESWGEKAAKSVAYTLSSSWVIARDVASGILNGRDPSVGIFSTAVGDIRNLARDIGKNAPLNREHAGRIIQDASVLAGLGTGLPGETIGRAGRFAQGVATGREHPKGTWGWLTGARYGTLKGHSGTLEQYMHGRTER